MGRREEARAFSSSQAGYLSIWVISPGLPGAIHVFLFSGSMNRFTIHKEACMVIFLSLFEMALAVWRTCCTQAEQALYWVVWPCGILARCLELWPGRDWTGDRLHHVGSRSKQQ